MKELIGTLKLKDKSKMNRVEGFCIVFLLGGALLLSLGILLSILNTKGISAIIAMFGSLIAFISTVVLIITWFVKDFVGE